MSRPDDLVDAEVIRARAAEMVRHGRKDDAIWTLSEWIRRKHMPEDVSRKDEARNARLRELGWPT